MSRGIACWICAACSDACEKGQVITEEECQLLRSLDDIKYSFSIWGNGRREDSDGYLVEEPPVEQPGEVIPGLFLGDLDDANDIPKLKKRRIKAVLNLCPERIDGWYSGLPERLRSEGVAHLPLPAQDMRGFDMCTEVIPQGCKFIDNYLVEGGGGVLVNCWGGVNRSTTVLVAYLVLQKGQSLQDAVTAATNVRGKVLTNRHFRLQLARLYVQAATGSLVATLPHF